MQTLVVSLRFANDAQSRLGLHAAQPDTVRTTMNDPDCPGRIAIIGAGNVAETSHMPAIRAQGPNAEVVVVAGVDPEHAGDFAERWQISARYLRLDKMLREATLDLVSVCTPPVARREAIVTFLDAVPEDGTPSRSRSSAGEAAIPRR